MVPLPLESWLSETGSIMVSVRSFEKKTLPYGSAIVLSTASSDQSLYFDWIAGYTIIGHSIIIIATQALVIMVIIIIPIILFNPWSRTFSLPSAPSSSDWAHFTFNPFRLNTILLVFRRNFVEFASEYSFLKIWAIKKRINEHYLQQPTSHHPLSSSTPL
jgi:ABC-type transport system involved in multi-copper enzyme maturation permease subunit